MVLLMVVYWVVELGASRAVSMVVSSACQTVGAMADSWVEKKVFSKVGWKAN